MHAISVDTKSEDRALRWEEAADPVAGAGEVIVDIHATAVNRADLLQRSGHYPPPPGAPDILGLEMAGVVADPAGSDLAAGDRVCALLAGGGYAERVAVDARLLLPVPDDWPMTRAAALPEVFLTAFVNLFGEAGLQGGETVLIHAGASGVGSAAIQLARHAGCRVLASAGNDLKRERCRQFGAEFVCDSRDEGFADEVTGYLNGAGVDVILDVAGGSHLSRNLHCLAPKGRLVLLSLLGGRNSEIDLGLVLTRRLRIIGSLLRSRPVDEKAQIVADFRARFWPPLLAGAIQPVVDRVLPIADAQEAHDVLSANANVGKVVLEVRGSD
ncbi:MAG TPA: NAD(P)H-quinone oxidoreductase [Candidatus Latescibacteria bacterium]|jgi:putative PIG3 family NAD(P)H quinone oxidoreductase|nr:NADPH:quinone oxidoreductase [Gemmatimonadota bacterium]MDP7365269.1 NAD(P)H-quinone oxidoreductase [Candidatus Latescibacterota bacterium]MDP7634890.1 NAD(P)H-quinone oxidoreductase [Candidatus Latescibacterota bacterium]HCV25337.1 NADPH:quinone oxidoreductase [Candidatus Latescibacterota bacterium]HJN28814.1 NAD(P)H-quinone oxidoreductase [Candidatus Latescibacterota bacterium]|tara:strand:+ start:453 stop:1436 length:984 start_codon:yes stop_codon:yes gene_type:complete